MVRRVPEDEPSVLRRVKVGVLSFIRDMCLNRSLLHVGIWHRACLVNSMDIALDEALVNAQNLIANGSYGEAADAFRVLFDRQVEGPKMLVALADAMAHVGQTDASLALLADSVDESDPNPATLLRISEQLRDVGRAEESADFLLCALACSPEDASIRLRTEDALKALGRTAQLEWLSSGAEGDMPLP
jgi:thioredoxin-like negative regulator of GroEL